MENPGERAIVERATDIHLVKIAEVNASAFAGNRNDISAALEWVNCWFRAFPLYQCFVIKNEDEVVGYIVWQIHGGFLREKPVVELEQIAITPLFQGKGLASKLIRESLREVCDWIIHRDSRIKDEIVVVVWTYGDNRNALRAYEREFPDGVAGMRIQYDGKIEVMLRRTIQRPFS